MGKSGGNAKEAEIPIEHRWVVPPSGTCQRGSRNRAGKYGWGKVTRSALDGLMGRYSRHILVGKAKSWTKKD